MAQTLRPKRKPDEPAGLSRDQESALLAIEQAMSELQAHGDGLSQWRLAQIARAIEALDRGDHRAALRFVEQARLPAEQISEQDRAHAAKIEKRLEVQQILAALAARRGGGKG